MTINGMARSVGMALIVLYLTIQFSIAAPKAIIDENFDKGYGNWDSSITVGGTFSLIEHDGGKALKVYRNSIQGNNYTQLKYRIPSNVIRGKHLMVQAIVKYENIEIGNKSYYGGHIDFEIMTPNGPQYEHAPFFVNSMDWTLCSFDADIPDNATTVDFRIGLQGAKGTIYFDDVKVFIME